MLMSASAAVAGGGEGDGCGSLALRAATAGSDVLEPGDDDIAAQEEDVSPGVWYVSREGRPVAPLTEAPTDDPVSPA